MNEHFIQIFTQFGLAGIIFGGFLMTLKWVFEVNNKILCNMDEERKIWQAQYREMADVMVKHNAHAKEFSDQVRTEHKASTVEHREMIAILGRINGYKKE